MKSLQENPNYDGETRRKVPERLGAGVSAAEDRRYWEGIVAEAKNHFGFMS